MSENMAKCPKCGMGTSLVLRDYTDGYRLACGHNCGFALKTVGALEFPLADLAQFFPIARLQELNSELTRSHNALLVDGANWQRRATKAEEERDGLLSALKGLRCDWCGFSVAQHLAEDFGPKACMTKDGTPVFRAILAIKKAEASK